MNALSSSDYQLDLEAYFQRIGYVGAAPATLDTLRTLHLLHTQTIPFENLDPLLHRPVRLDLQSIEAKLVRSRRGGYCYEHNLLFSHVLERLGFKVTNLVARVLLGLSDNTIRPRTHMLLLVQLDQRPYIVDVGFGGNTLTIPLQLDIETAQDTPQGPYRIQAVQGDYILQVLIQSVWKPLYQFDLTRQFPVDYIAVNYYLSTSNNSQFCHSLFAALATQQGRHTMLNHTLATRTSDGMVQHTQVNNAHQAMDLLLQVFNIQVPDHAAFVAAWYRLT